MKNETIKSFEGLRAIAALLILFSHLAGYIPVISGLSLGANGVSIFLMLSGFCTLYAYETRWETAPGLRDVLAFVRKKLRKFYPLHFITFLMVLPMELLALITMTGNAPLIKRAAVLAVKSIMNLLLIQSFLPVQDIYFSLNPVSWYLSDTLFFCICTPFLLYLLHRMKPDRNKKAAAAFVLLFFLQTAVSLVFYKSRLAHAILYISPLYRIGEFIQGCLLGFLFVHRPPYMRQQHRIACSAAELLAAGLFLFLLLNWQKYPAGLGYSVLFIPATALLLFSLAFDQGILSQLLKVSVLQFFGGISFELFLVHLVVFRYIDLFCSYLPPISNAAHVAIAVPTAIAMSFVMHLLLKLLSRRRRNP